MSVWLDDEALAKTAPAERAALPLADPHAGRLERRVHARAADRRAAAGRARDRRARRPLHGRRLRHGPPRVPADELRHGGRVPRHEPRVRRALRRRRRPRPPSPRRRGARRARCAQQPIIDVQLHFVRDDFRWDGILELGEYAKRWNPVLAREGVTMQRYKFENFLKEVFLDSDTRVGPGERRALGRRESLDRLERAARAGARDRERDRRLAPPALRTP